MAKHKTTPCPVPKCKSVPQKVVPAQQFLCPTTLTLFQENRSFCCRSGQLLMTSGSNISSQSLRRPEAGPGQADSALWTKQGQCHWWYHAPRPTPEFPSLPWLTCNSPLPSLLVFLLCPGATRSTPQQLVSWQDTWQWSQQ